VFRAILPRKAPGRPSPTCTLSTGSCRLAAQPSSEPSRSIFGMNQAVAKCSCGRLGAPPGATRWPVHGNPPNPYAMSVLHPRPRAPSAAFLGSTCRSRATLPGVRRPSDRAGSPREAWSEGRGGAGFSSGPSARRRISPPLAGLPSDDLLVREVSEDGWGGRRQDPLAERTADVASLGRDPLRALRHFKHRISDPQVSTVNRQL